ncbi:hypothetical protein D3C71_2026790 [compost metagenome]
MGQLFHGCVTTSDGFFNLVQDFDVALDRIDLIDRLRFRNRFICHLVSREFIDHGIDTSDVFDRHIQRLGE